MGLFTFLLIFFLIYFIVWPLVRTSMRVRSAMHQMRDMADQASRQTAGTDSRRNGNSSNAAGSRKYRTKKIDPNIGEYVDFEEISGERSSDPDGNTAGYRTEQQIADAEWVDIPNDK